MRKKLYLLPFEEIALKSSSIVFVSTQILRDVHSSIALSLADLLIPFAVVDEQFNRVILFHSMFFIDTNVIMNGTIILVTNKHVSVKLWVVSNLVDIYWSMLPCKLMDFARGIVCDIDGLRLTKHLLGDLVSPFF